MSGSEKKTMLDLPLKVILTEEGASHFIQNRKKLLRIKLADNVEEYGISMNTFAPQSVQRMILLDYISKIEISMPEFASSRQEVMDLSKLVVFSLLYKQFDREVFTGLTDSECIRKHNRSNPSQLIDERTKMSDAQLRTRMANMDSTIAKARKQILDPLWAAILENQELSTEEKNVNLLMTEKFLNEVKVPKRFSNVTRWASSHHELLNGKGYPRHLSQDEIEKEIRLLSILDVFDALTANDRPYKPPMPAEKAFFVLADMVKFGELDGKILELFKSSNAWKG